MPTKNSSLIVTAHPDDETIFFTGLILSRPTTRWTIICVTNGNADGSGKKRLEDFKNACQQLGVENFQCLNHPDIFEKRINTNQLIESLKTLEFDEVFTHGPIGEYGHPHHQDVSYACHTAFLKKSSVYSISYNSCPDFTVSLSPEHWNIKAKILTSTYFSETQRFFQFLPVTFSEGFLKVEYNEVQELYHHFANKTSLDINKLHRYKSIFPYLKNNNFFESRPF
ncbi:MAG: PIG-L family deacetylase [Bdellovibrionales bacterium]|nr:PIG-L family deacetylase [Bdellovibrionales bacterium]